MFPGKSREQIRSLLPETARILDLTIDVALSPTLTDEDIDDLRRAVGKIMRERRKRGR